MPEHNTLSGTSLHEPKGVGALTGGLSDTDKVYLSDGAGSGSWAHPTSVRESAHLSIGDATLNATVTTLTLQDTWYPVSGTWTEEDAEGMTTTPASGKLVVTTAGDYFIIADISFIISTSNDIPNFSFLVDGVKGTPRIRTKVGTGTDVGHVSLHTEVHNLIVGQEIQIGVASISAEPSPLPAGATLTVENANFTAILVKVH